jgi:uncharacterized membrane protein YgaE (UPF0421/DUF939 family)
MIGEKDKTQRKRNLILEKVEKILWSKRNVVLSYFEIICTHKHQKQASHQAISQQINLEKFKDSFFFYN